jgi:hypothetical protein
VGVVSQVVNGGGIFPQGFPAELLVPLYRPSAFMLQNFVLQK